eukprot:m.322810 g.322810  ORF g.322810 m.322810 type:complete len:79 (-) comp16455_c0_seq10:3886-4122(-)
MTARVTVVGSGIAGLSAAYHIAKHGTVEVTLFEKNDVLGGHEMTHDTKYGQVRKHFLKQFLPSGKLLESALTSASCSS